MTRTILDVRLDSGARLLVDEREYDMVYVKVSRPHPDNPDLWLTATAVIAPSDWVEMTEADKQRVYDDVYMEFITKWQADVSSDGRGDRTLTLHEWLTEAAEQGYPIRDRFYAADQRAQDVIAQTDSAILAQPVRIFNADELRRPEGLRLAMADTPSGTRWMRIEPHPDTIRKE